jgi:hypothetical protein
MAANLESLLPSVKRRLRKELDDTERVAWLARPAKMSLVGPGSVWLGLGLFVAACALILIPLRNAYAWSWWVVATPGGLAAASMLSYFYSVGPGRPVYGVTDRRAFLLIPGLGGNFYYWYPQDLRMRRLRAGDDGSGDIILGAEFDWTPTADGERVPRRRYDGAWYDLPDMGEAEAHLLALMRRDGLGPS